MALCRLHEARKNIEVELVIKTATSDGGDRSIPIVPICFPEDPCFCGCLEVHGVRGDREK